MQLAPSHAWFESRAGGWALALLAHPRRTVAWLIALHVLLWWGAIVVGQRNLPLDVMEIAAWARDPGWATHKLPPLTVWLFWLFERIGGGAQWVVQAQAPLAMGVTLWALWRLGLAAFSPPRALLALLLVECVGAMTFQAALFNQNAVQIPFWALTALCLWRALESGQLWLWAATGALAALCLLGKYFGVYLLTALFLFLVAEPSVRRVWRTPGPYLTAFVALAVLAPHLRSVALDYDWQPFEYALERAVDAGHWSDHLTAPLGWFLAQGVSLWSALIAFALLLLPRGRSALPPERPETVPRRYLLTLAFLPFGLALLSSAITGSRFVDPWGIPLWTFLPLGVLALGGRGIARRGLGLGLLASLACGLGALLLQLGWLVGPLVLKEMPRELFDGPALAREAERAWTEAAPGGGPPAYLVGSFWLAGNVAWYGPWGEAGVYVNALRRNSPWVDEERLAREGGVLIWSAGADDPAEPPWLPRLLRRLKQPPLVVSEPVAIPWRLYDREPPRVRLAVIPPAPD